VNVDIGVACLHLGDFARRHDDAQQLAEELFAHADKRLYAVKRGTGLHIACEWFRVDGRHLTGVAAT
jgi:hypothetical protein